MEEEEERKKERKDDVLFNLVRLKQQGTCKKGGEGNDTLFLLPPMRPSVHPSVRPFTKLA
jgi:hypothetical protein